MADVPDGSFTHTLEQIDAATTQVEDAKGNAASLAAAITAAAETAASTAIEALDVSSVGGTGKYISEIKQEDGKISATPTSLASAPASGGTAAISSGAVYTALSDKIGISDVFGYGTSISSNANLNSIKTPGVYYFGSADGSGLTNSPVTDAVFKLEVRQISTNAERIIQTVYPLYSTGTWFIRLKTGNSDDGWQQWVRYDNPFGTGRTLAATSSKPINLDLVADVGRYQWSYTQSQYISGLPYSRAYGTMTVEYIRASFRIRQTFVPDPETTAAKVGTYYVRMKYGVDAETATWSNWFKFEGTEVIP